MTADQQYPLDFTDHLLSDDAADLAELREIELLVGGVPAEALLEGPPADADLLLRRTVREIRDRGRGRVVRVSRLAQVAIAAATVAVAVVSGLLVARIAAPDSPVTAAPSIVSPVPSSRPVPGTRSVDVTDPADGARLTARIVPMAGWVRIHAEVAGVPAGERCRIVVVAADGRREIAGSWRAPAGGTAEGMTFTGAAVVDPAAVRAVLVEDTAGRELVRATV